MNIKRIVLASIVLWVLGTVFMFLTCGWLFNWVYQIPPLIWLSAEEMMSPKNMVISNLLGLLKAFIFVGVFAFLYKALPSKGVKKGMVYGFILWLTGALAGISSMPLYMTIAPVVVIYWIWQALVWNMLAGALVGVIYKVKK